MPYAIFGLICVGLLGASLFTTGIIFSMTPMVGAGIVFLGLSIFGMLVHHVYCKQTPNLPAQIKTAVHYTSNNMNTMKRNHIIAEDNNTLTPSAFSTKRNKSDTDLELINRQQTEIDAA